MDTKRLPLSMLIALGLAPAGCDELGCVTRPCLNVAEPDPPPAETKGEPADTKGTPTDSKGEPQPCLSPPMDPSGVQPCLEVLPCLSPPPQDPETKTGPCLDVERPEPETKTRPCLDVQPCLSRRPDPSRKCLSAMPMPKDKPSDGGMARGDVLDRLLERDVLPPDVATKLRGRSEDA